MIPSNRCRNIFLLAASYYFYMCWQPSYALLLLSSTFVTYLAGLLISKYRSRAKLFLSLSLIINLGILFFYKYYAFAAENITAFMDLFGVAIHVPEFKVLLPVGISFYIFQALGYSIDVARGDIKAEKNFLTYALFVSFFPQLVAGPIERSTNLLRQFYTKHTFDGHKAIEGIHLMLWGFFLKLVIADRCAMYVNDVYNDLASFNGGSVLLASILFCFNLYGDFAGYSYIAQGCAKVMGFELMDNFRRPYFFSTSVQDFWKRNHISLTTWFMDYIYYPLVGSSSRLAWWCLCMFLTFFISGFWHGAAWTYVISFSIFGFYLVICVLKDKKQRQFEKKYGLKKKEWWLWLNRIITFFLVMLALIFFRANSLSDGFLCLKKILTEPAIPQLAEGILYTIITMALLMFLFISEYIVEYKKFIISEKNYLKSYIIASNLLLWLVIILGMFETKEFIYFQF